MTTKPKPGPAKPRTRRKKPLGSHPLDERLDHIVERSVSDVVAKAQKVMAASKPRPFYTTPPGGEPVIPREPPRMTIEGRAEAYRTGGYYWGCSDHYGELGGLPVYDWDRARALGLLDDRL